MERVWSLYQQGIFDFAEKKLGNLLIGAVAGSGKTTTLVELVRRLKGTTLFLAFNKAIADELKKRGVNARTFHSLTYTPVMKARGTRDVNTNKLRAIIDANLSDNDVKAYGSFITKLVGIGRQQGIGCLVPDLPSSWEALVAHHDLELDHETATLERGIALASKLLAWSNESGEVDFDDMLYFAVKDGLVLPKFDNVLVDEAQDTNAIQRALLRKVLRPNSRLFAVGDPAQAIYGFRGADANSMQLIADEFSCAVLPLSVSYRCPRSVVEYARNWVKHIEPAPDAPMGRVSIPGSWKPQEFQAKDLIVCRTTKPLISLAYTMLRARVPCRILGREIGQGLIALVKRMKARNLTMLVERLQEYTVREVEKATAKKLEAKAEAIQDKSDSIMFLVDSLDESSRTIEGLMDLISHLFEDKANCATLATIHKAKGLEAERVYWLDYHKCPAKWAKQEWQQQQERNLCYVATTRAVKELVLIQGEGS